MTGPLDLELFLPSLLLYYLSLRYRDCTVGIGAGHLMINCSLLI